MPSSPSTFDSALVQKKLFFLLLSTTFILVVFFYAFHSSQEKNIYQSYLEEIKHTNFNNVSKLTTSFNTNKKHISFLSELPSVQHLTQAIAEADNLIEGTHHLNYKADITEAFKALLNYTKEIKQARLILHDGSEYIRVERHDSDIIVTPENLLQSKEHRDYFQVGIQLPKEESYVSLITPNYEHGKLDYPLWPTYRITKSLSTHNKQNIGILVLNIDARLVLKELNNPITALGPTFENYLIDSQGGYVAAPFPDLLFGKDLNKKEMNWFIHTDNQTPLTEIDEIQTTFRGEPYLFTAQAISFSDQFKHQQYYLLTGIPIDTISQAVELRRNELLISICVFVSLMVIIVFGFMRHIRHLKKLNLDQSHFQAIISNSTDAILSVNSDGNILSWNQAATILFGLSDTKALNTNVFSLIPASKANNFNPELLIDILSNNTNTQIEINSKTSVYTERTLLATLCPIKLTNQPTQSIALIIRDITHQKENQKKLEAMNQALDSEVKKRTEEFEVEKQKAIRANQSKSLFVANISHEIRTPLNGINGLLSLARKTQDDLKQDNYLKLAQDSATSLNILINDLLDFSKIESGKLELNPTHSNLLTLVEQVITSISFLIKNKDIELILDSSRIEVNWLLLDENRVKQILTNLLSNAVKFTTEGEIILTVASYNDKTNADFVVCDFQVSDSGVGIPKEQQNKLFKPFMQASSGISNKYGGTGLGLSISKQLCEMMNGKLSVQSELGTGSTFKASIKTKATPTSLEQATGTPPSSSGLSAAILVENVHLSRVLRKQLHLWQINCISSNKENDFINSLQTDIPDFVLIDDNFCSQKLDQQLKDFALRSIYLVNKTDAIGHNFINEYLAKPITPSSLIQLINQPIKVQKPKELKKTPSSTNALKPSHDQRVYVVDDNEINRIVGTGILNSLPFKLETASNGEVLIQKLLELPPSRHLPVILMDCQMPILDGYQATRLIREGKAGDWLKNAPIIALTADAMIKNQEECSKAGMNDFVSKPFDPDRLIEVVLNWTKEKT